MEWTWANFIIHLVAAPVGALLVLVIAREYSIGALNHVMVGIVAGIVSGYFLQTVAATVVMGDGSLNQVAAPTNFVMQVLAGLGVGVCAAMAVGFCLHVARERNGSSS